MSAAAVLLTWAAGLMVGFLVATVFFLKRQVEALRSRLIKVEAVAENQDARIFMLEQEQRWLASQGRQRGEAVSEH